MQTTSRSDEEVIHFENNEKMVYGTYIEDGLPYRQAPLGSGVIDRTFCRHCAPFTFADSYRSSREWMPLHAGIIHLFILALLLSL